METLPDLLAPTMRVLSIGLNPSLPSVAAGFYFANPRNRFWKALNASRLLQSPVTPGPAAMQLLLQRERMGFTDIVKRPTRGVADLKAADYRVGAPRLRGVLENFQPAYAWFHGKVAYKQFVRHADLNSSEDVWGRQSLRLGTVRFFVTPNPSPANAAFSLDTLIDWFNALADEVY
ncbi:G/U mismatch-specific uracil DNA glycosylase [hydrothermal vent metagenome]|uniref:G/U mismatch-specific uracil DNA glycosylase n=1 Tax=hydrothermal vent metagenome TaxID=652676 RepID=A0A3B0YZI5_9ZZZZ